jgi:hypothetical protein
MTKEAKHTPEPWVRRGENGLTIRAVVAPEIPNDSDGFAKGERVVAVIYDGPEALANAELIVSAPRTARRVTELENLIIDYCDDHCDGAPDGGHAAHCIYRDAFPLGR